MSKDPLYLHLLSDRDLVALNPLLGYLREHRETVLHKLHGLYQTHFGAERALTEEAFLTHYGRDLDAVTRSLAEQDLVGFTAEVRALGYDLCERGVPFTEVVATLHLFEEACAAVYRPFLQDRGVDAAIQYALFDKLSHCRLMLLATTYFESFRAQSEARARSLESELARLAPGDRRRFEGLVGQSAGMQRVYDVIDRLSQEPGGSPMLLCGEPGVGKELAARALHERTCATRPAGLAQDPPFVALRCAAYPREALEGELFAPGGGLWQAAAGGTLFVDEVTELPQELQLRLLFGTRDMEGRGPAWVLLCSNRDVDRAAATGLLAPDLLLAPRLTLPPLRERPEDIAPLCEHFAARLKSRGLRAINSIEPEALTALRGYPWPGNVNELAMAVDHALTVGEGEVLRLADLPAHIAAARLTNGVGAPVPTMEQGERDLIVRALAATEGNKLRAARLLHISRHRLYDKLRKYSIEM